MINRLFLALLMILPNSSFAMEEVAIEEEINFCLDTQAAIDNYALAEKHPEDPRLIRLVALRTGLCDLLAKEIIELEFAIDLFDQMQAFSVRDQLQDNMQDNQSNEANLIDI